MRLGSTSNSGTKVEAPAILTSRNKAAGPLMIGACSDRLHKSEGSLLRCPVHRDIKTAGPQCLRGKLGRLTACHNPLHHLGRQKRQTYEPADVLLADSVAPGDLDHRSASATHEIVEPAVRSRHGPEQRLIGFAGRFRPAVAVDYESKLNPSPPELHGYATLD